jgi:predicted O-methyltransferase YrrM
MHPSREPGLALLWLRLRYRRLGSIPTDMTPAERLLLLRLAKAVCRAGGTNLVEVGSYLGASSCFIAEGIRAAGSSARLYCVDTWKNDAMSEGTRDTWEEFRRNTAPYGTAVEAVRKRSVEAAASFGRPVDFLFVDADHSYEAVRADIEAWFPLLAPGAVAAFHDVLYFEGARRAFHEFVVPRGSVGRGRPNLAWARMRGEGS